MKKIDSMNESQWTMMREFREEWLSIGLSTEPANKPLAESSVEKMYGLLGKKRPTFIWCDSPLSCNIAIHIIKNLKIGKDQLWDQLGDQLRDQLWGQLWDQLWDQLRDQLWDQLRDQLWGQLGDQLEKTKIEFNASYLIGQQEGYWISHYLFPIRIGVNYKRENIDKLEIWSNIAKSCNWWYPFENFCFISDRPKSISMSDGRLHCDNGPSVLYRDGWNLWSINGVRVNEQIVMNPKLQTIKEVQSEKNEEVKRIRIERFGWERYLRDTNAIVLDKRRNDIECSREALMKTSDNHTILVCRCPSTHKVFTLEVPSEIQTCESAQDWLNGGASHYFTGRA